MLDDFRGMLWSYRAVFKQTAGGGGNIVVNITANQRMVLLYAGIGQNAYAAGRTIVARVRDDSGVDMAIIFSSAAVDGALHNFPDSDHSIAAASDGPYFEKRIVLGKGDFIFIQATGLVLNEELTLHMRALITSVLPTITTTGSTGTVTTTTTHSKVI